MKVWLTWYRYEGTDELIGVFASEQDAWTGADKDFIEKKIRVNVNYRVEEVEVQKF